jgi:hypothetical protein
MRTALLIVSFTLSSAALAGPECTTEAPSKWIPAEEMKAKALSSGYKIDVFKMTTGNCYEIYGRNPAGKRVEVYYHPITGDVVKTSAR